MNIIGIDFSILYPGICISNDFKDFKWIGIANNKITKKDTKLMEEISLTYPNLKLHCSTNVLNAFTWPQLAAW